MPRALPESGHARRVTIALRSVLPPRVHIEASFSRGSDIDLKIAGHRIRARWVGSGFIGETRAALGALATPVAERGWAVAQGRLPAI